MGYSLAYFNALNYDDLAEMFHINMEKGAGEGIFSGCVAFGAIFGAGLQKKSLEYFGRKYLHLYLGIVSSFPMQLQWLLD